MTSSASTSLRFVVSDSDEIVEFSPQRLIIAGYTGRDRDSVQAHIDELARIGIPPPPRVPMFYEIPAELVTTSEQILVGGAHSSGEVEPVLIQTTEALYLGLGSDHTDREVEKRDIGESKASAPKPVGSRIIAFDRVRENWDRIAMHCEVDGSLYQSGSLSALLSPDVLLEELAAAGGRLDPGTVMFCGTVPLLDHTFVYGSHYQLTMGLPDGTILAHAYGVTHH
jgi:Protein of unknown function (DUF2848)